MRCEQCSKFVSMDNGDPQVDNIEAQFDGREGFDLTASVTGTRNCADCGTELKTLSMDMEAQLDLEDIEEYKALSDDKKKAVIEALKKGTADIDISENSGNVDEGGGGRYQKNMITTTIDYSLEIVVNLEDSDDTITLTHNGNLSSENAASEFEEC